MKQNKSEYSPFKTRLQTRRVFETPERKDSRRGLVYRTTVAGVLAKMN